MLDNASIIFNCVLILLICLRAIKYDPDIKQNTPFKNSRAP